MRKQIRRARSGKPLRRHYRHTTCCASHQRAYQTSRKAMKASYITSLVGLALYVLLTTMLASACFITQSYTMLPILNVMVHELGYIVRHMLESVFARRRSQQHVEQRRRNLRILLEKRIGTTDRAHDRSCDMGIEPSTSLSEHIDL